MRNGLAWLMATTLLAAGASAAPRSWELREGRWQEVNTPTTAPIREETLDRVEELLRAGQPSQAKKVVVAWLLSHKDSPVRDRGLYLLGECNFAGGDRIMSFYNFDELLDFHSTSPYFYRALQRQYDIADAYLDGYKEKFLGLRIVGAIDEAIEILYRIQQRAPGSPLAEGALLRTASYYYDNGDMDLAADAYGAYVRAYPRSPNVPRARLRQAYSSMQQFRGTKFDPTPVIDARQQLADLAADYPDLARQENLSALMERLDSALAIKMLQTAAFYRRTHEPRAAAYYYRYILRVFPSTPEADTARTELASLPPAAAAELPPLGPPATRPATQPTR